MFQRSFKGNPLLGLCFLLGWIFFLSFFFFFFKADHFESLYWIRFNIICVLVFWPWGTWDLSFPTWGGSPSPALERDVSTTGPPGKSRDCFVFDSVFHFPVPSGVCVYSCHAFLLAFFPLSSCRNESAQIFVVLGVGNFSIWSFSLLPPDRPVRVWRLLFLLMFSVAGRHRAPRTSWAVAGGTQGAD